MFGERLTKTQRPIESPVNLDTGSPTAKEATSMSLFVLGSIFAASGGSAIALFSFPTGYAQWTIIRFIGFSFGASIFLASSLYGLTMFRLSIGLWNDYRDRLYDWHQLTLQSAENMYGAETTVSYDRWRMDTESFKDIWSIIAIIHQAYHNENMRMYTRRELEKPLFASAMGYQVRIGEAHGADPEKIGTILSRLGLISGRTDRVAGEWIPSTLEEAYTLTVKNWSKSQKRYN